LPEPRSALLVAHPGHELLLHGWLRAARPRVCVLTDGSGRDGDSRLDATTRVLERADASSGPLYGRYPDRVIYEALLDGDTSFFVGLAQELAKSLAGDDIEVTPLGRLFVRNVAVVFDAHRRQAPPAARRFSSSV